MVTKKYTNQVTPQKRLPKDVHPGVEIKKQTTHSTKAPIVDKYNQRESVLEAFLTNATTMPLHSAVEEIMTISLKAQNVIMWQDVPSLHALYSEKIKKSIDHSVGLVGYTFFRREIVKIPNVTEHQAYSPEIDGEIVPNNSSVIIFPLWDLNNNVCAVVEVIRDSKNPFFDNDDEEFIEYFIRKYKFYCTWLRKQPHPHQQCLELMQLMEVEQFLILLQRKISELYNCRVCEIWKYDKTNGELQQYKRSKISIDINHSGIVGEAILNEIQINCMVNKLQSSYCEEVDGSEAESVLAVPVVDPKQNTRYVVCVRGRKDLPMFTMDDEVSLKDLAPYIILALDNNERYSQSGSGDQRNENEHQCVKDLTDIIEMLNDESTIDDIVQKSVESSRRITNSERSYMYILDKQKQVLTPIVAPNLRNVEPFPITTNNTITQTYKSGEVTNVSDVYEELHFDKSSEIENGFKTKSLLSIPIKNARKEVIGVVEFHNKHDGKPFSSTDINYVNLLMYFCGLYIDNQTTYEKSAKKTQQYDSLLQTSTMLTSSDNIKTLLTNLLQIIKQVIDSDCGSIFLVDDALSSLTSYIVDGANLPPTIPISNGIAATTVKTKEALMINDAYHDPRFNKFIDYTTGYKTKSLLTVPLTSTTGTVYGAIELVNKNNGDFTQDDFKLLKTFGIFASVIMEKSRLLEISEYGSVIVEMNKWIGEAEKKSYQQPQKLTFPEDKREDIFKLNFFCIDYNGIGLFKVAYTVFDEFSLLEKFKITNELFFNFLYKLRETYNEPPYHNWIHAIDVLQYFAYQIKITKLNNILNSLELLAICVASICHDVGHMGFNNAYNINAETPLGILYKDQSVMEMHHCDMAIHIISKDTCNIFYSISENDKTKLWKWIITMILATDMAHHFKLLKNANDIMDQGPINLANESHRIMAMTMLMKVADISNVSRPFPIADKWCDVLSEEFWRQGDCELAHGLEISSNLNDRNNKQKAKGQIGFYTFVCIPLYQAMARIFPELECNVDSVKSNLEVWKKLQAEEDEKNNVQNQQKN
ncbi:3'5'-cyclic nucleotide phosphodiesterase family protein [Histomonas meleagridis]|uniref:3'5'-cyclic nucleotide phosphodiesterase family protein n=1 Tax=Histomonas meleagridis TaxID=135588 RepID=UPI00355A14F8|nr:3'5'-cyclic nucleotide phosphodiesterase family protein [Histomonas meleagridis]KAH0806027.1 3'5'-cyclic nucleotide phosphodiesterase family protein [Histomonas meleagridis]